MHRVGLDSTLCVLYNVVFSTGTQGRLLQWQPDRDVADKKALLASHPDLQARFLREGALRKESLLADIDFATDNTIETDANGAIGIISRRGLGKTRGIELAYLWLQDAFERQRIVLRKIPGHLNRYW